MPLIKMQTQVPLSKEHQTSILAAMSDIIEKETGKPASVIMATIEQTPIMIAGKTDNAALFDIRGIGGLTQPINQAITKSLCTLCQEMLNIPPERIYATFTEVPRSNWGWNNKTF